MNRMTKITLLLLATSAASVHAQAGRVRVYPSDTPLELARTAIAIRGTGSVERMLRLRDELKLTEAQVSQLETIRKEQVARRQEEARERIDLESRAAAGMIEREVMRRQLEDRADKAFEQSEATRDRVERILTDQQRDQLRNQMRETFIRPRVFGEGLRMEELRARALNESLRARRYRELLPRRR